MTTPSPRAILRKAILEGFDPDSLEQLLAEGAPSRDFTDLVPAKAAFDRQVFELINRAIDEKWLKQFVDDALGKQSGNVLFVAAVRPIADKIRSEGLDAAMGPEESLDSTTPELSKRTDKLLTAANEASGLARSAWFAFPVLLALLLVTLYGVSHKDLLLNSQVNLPVVNLAIPLPLTSFFQFAPALLLIAYLSLLIQHVILAHKYRKFTEAIAPYENIALQQHPARDEVHSYVVSQVMAGAPTNAITNWIMHLIVFVSFALLPIATLLYFQIKFLPFQDVPITYWHRIAVLLGLVMLFTFLPLIYLKIRKREVRIGAQKAWRASPSEILLGAVLATLVLGFSWMIATVPNERLDEFLGFASPTEERGRLDTPPFHYEQLLLNPLVRFAYERLGQMGDTRDKARFLSRLISYRILVADDLDFVPDEGERQNEVSVVLRERNLRFAKLNRSDLHRADLRHSDLGGAELWLGRLEGAELREAQLQNAELSYARLKDANLEKANLVGASLSDANLEGAYLRYAELQGSHLSGASLQGAGLFNTKLQGAQLLGAKLQGASFRSANLEGANLRYAELEGADLRDAQLQGADLSGARLQGASLHRANLQGAVLCNAKLQGAKLTDAELQGTDLTGAEIWLADFPRALLNGASAPHGLAYLQTSSETFYAGDSLKGYLRANVTDGKLLRHLLIQLGPILGDKPSIWRDESLWTRYRTHAKESPLDETVQFQASLVCGDSLGHIAEGMVQRASDYFYEEDEGLRSYAKLLARALLAQNCKGARWLNEKTRKRLSDIGGD